MPKGKNHERACCAVGLFLTEVEKSKRKWEAISRLLFMLVCKKEAGNPGDDGVGFISK